MDTNGYLIISLDFELFWGLFDVKSINSYEENLLNVRKVIPRLLELANSYNIKLSFASLGFIFAKDKSELLQALPIEKPTYSNQDFNPYNIMDSVGNSEEEDPFHFANSLIQLIQNNGNHEIASHTFSHFYVNESGQTVQQFEEDLKAAIAIAQKNNVELKSIIFPRNQINNNYLPVCKKHGITSYRGTECHWMFDTHDTKTLEKPFYKAFRLLDAYINLSGYNTYAPKKISNNYGLINLPSSKFFRPFNKTLSFLEPIRISRIKKGISYAAKNNEVYHLWWHPHNFGRNIEENFKNLEQIFEHYKHLNETYGFKSNTMSQFSRKIIDKYY